MIIDPLYAFVFAGLFSPGPNVILLTASGARFGLRATIPHILGVTIGTGIIAAATAFGIAALLLALPGLALGLRLGAFVWIVFMAVRLMQAGRRDRADTAGRPFSFVQAVLFQWVNPKLWAVALAASAGYPGGGGPLDEGLRLGAAFSGLNLFVCLFWTWAGTLLALLLSSPRAWRVFTTVMALLLGLSAIMVLFPPH